MEYVKDNINPNFTILRMDSYAYPVAGVPSWEKNNAAGLANFNYTVSVTVPDSLTVINGGKLISKKISNGTAEYIYENIKTAWRIDIAIAKYSSISNNGFTVHYFPEDSSGAKIISAAVLKSYALYSEWFGKIDFSGYSIIEIPDNWGSQTDVSCIIQTAAAFKNKSHLFELYHELSHLWNISSKDENPCRLESEGLAMFLQYLATEKFENKSGLLDSAAAVIFTKLKKRFESDSSASNTPIIDYGKKHITELSYTKGMLFFYLLYKTAGETDFMKAIRNYYLQYRSAGSSTVDFSNYLVKELKNKKIDLLVKDWILTNTSSNLYPK